MLSALLALCFAVTAGHVITSPAPAPDSDLGWEHDSYPIGCGWFGANVFGRVGNERIQITHNAMHIPDPQYRNKAALTDALEIRLVTDHTNETNYARGLDLATAIAWTEYTAGGVRYRREAFASYPDRVLVVRLTADRKGALSFTLAPYAPFLEEFGADRWGRGRGRRATTTVDGKALTVFQELNGFGILCAATFRVMTDGTVSDRPAPSGRARSMSAPHALAVTGATEATVVMAIDTNYRLSSEVFREQQWSRKLKNGPDPRPLARAAADAAAKRGYAELKKRHLADYTALFDRVAIDLGGRADDAKTPTAKLIDNQRNGRRSSYLAELFVQFGRYLLISSSRPGTLPANLQGVWNCHKTAPWGSGYWHNINVQMNYWPAFSGNLAECFEPYAAYNEAVRVTKSDVCYKFVRQYTPENLPNANEPMPDWWVIGTANYPYLALGGPGGHDGPGIGGLTTRLFTDWWEFTQDRTVLEKHAFPALHGMANFLTRCVRNFDGKYLAAFSASPEQIVENKRQNWFDDIIGVPYYHTVGCAFDQQLIWQNAHDFLRMADALGTNDTVVAKCREQIDRYDPVQIGASGQIKEYREENFYGEIGEKKHRHISHLMGLMPGTLINRTTPAWMAAAKKTLEFRGDDSTGWALAHRLNAWARAGDGDHAYKLYDSMIRHRTYDNCWDAHPPFQIDGNFGATAGVIEMLLQSQAGFIDLLPALPTEWAKGGSFRGLCARGAFEVDCAWSNGVPTAVTVRSKKGLIPDVRFAGRPYVGNLTVEGVKESIGFKITCNRSETMLKLGEEVVFTVTATNGAGMPVTSGRVETYVNDYTVRPPKTREIDLAAENPFVLRGTMFEPGFLRFVITGDGAPRTVRGAGFAPEKIRAAGTCPPDFDAFWKNSREKLAREVPLDPRLVRVPERSKGAFDYWRVSFATLGGQRVWGFLTVPKDKSKAPFPARFMISSAGTGSWTWGFEDARNFDTVINMSFTVHAFEPPTNQKDADRLHAELSKELMAKYGVSGYQSAGFGKSREEVYFYRTLLGIDRAVDWLRARPDVDKTSFVYAGGSQGGGLGIALLALNPVFTGALLHVPAMMDALGFTEGRIDTFPSVGTCYTGRPDYETALRSVAYYNGAFFAARVTCPIRFSMGLIDEICPPTGVFAAYNALGSKDKDVIVCPWRGHGWWPEREPWEKWLNRKETK